MTVGEESTALTALAAAVTLLGGSVRQAVNFADKALALDPNHAWAWMRRGFGLVYMADPEAGLVSFERATRLSPLDPFAFNNQIGMGLAHFSSGRLEEATAYVTRALAERPGLTWPYRDLAVYRAYAGDLAGARDALEKFVYLRPPMSLASIADGLRFMAPSLLSRYLEGLRIAGLD